MEKTFNTELQARTREYMESTGTSQAELARRLGMPGSTNLSRWLSSSYQGDVGKIERSLEDFFRLRSEEKKSEATTMPFLPSDKYVPTSISRSVYASIEYCQLHRCVGVLHGDAGIGKTTAAEKFAMDHPDSTILLTMRPSTASLNGVCKMLAKELQVPVRGNRYDMMEVVRERLSGTDKVIVVDEAQMLNLPAIEELRALADKGNALGVPGNGVVFIGNSIVYDRILGRADAEFAQLFSRARMPNRYKASNLTLDDIRLMFPAEKGEAELQFLLSISKSFYGLRLAKSVYLQALESFHSSSIENLKKVAYKLSPSITKEQGGRTK